MTIFAEASCEIRTGVFRHDKKVIARNELPPGDYIINHDPAHLEVKVGKNGEKDVLTLVTKSVRRIEPANGDMEFSGQALFGMGFLAGLPTDEISISPQVGKQALRLGPDSNGVTLSLVSLLGENYGEEPLGEKILKNSILPKDSGQTGPGLPSSAAFGGIGIGIGGG